MNEWLLPALFGLGTGILSAWGVGGGTLLLLCMTLFLGVDQRQAQAINVLFFLPTAGAGLFFHGRNGYLHKPTWRGAVLPGALAALAASLMALGWDAEVFRRPFGIFLLYAGASMLWKIWKERKSGKKTSEGPAGK